eukprot:TRINITY_DN3214_c0_g4_i1.p1 TRINITY_DN3214_c0_g4~~TRINITY_DN3214_c0_g4_i1.p1  ORF type:complete len:107 (+),score=24.83 TRINITY_DN3214_c0_g4_i1:42-323(+)
MSAYEEGSTYATIVAGEGLTNPSKSANDVCFRRCATSFKHEASMELGEKTCMSRCVKKFYETYVATMQKRDEVTNLIKEEKYDKVERLVGPVQ